MRYYFFKLTTNFFEKDEVKAIEMQKNGDKYLVFLMKLMLRSLTDDPDRPGRLMFQGRVVYDENLLAKLTGTDVDVVKSSIDLFLKLGILSAEQDGGAFIPWVADSVDSETDSAVRMRRFRSRKTLISMSQSDAQCDTNVASPLISKTLISSGVREDSSEDRGDISKDLPVAPHSSSKRVRPEAKRRYDECMECWKLGYSTVMARVGPGQMECPVHGKEGDPA